VPICSNKFVPKLVEAQNILTWRIFAFCRTEPRPPIESVCDEETDSLWHRWLSIEIMEIHSILWLSDFFLQAADKLPFQKSRQIKFQISETVLIFYRMYLHMYNFSLQRKIFAMLIYNAFLVYKLSIRRRTAFLRAISYVLL
jgi:hypothetical protein